MVAGNDIEAAGLLIRLGRIDIPGPDEASGRKSQLIFRPPAVDQFFNVAGVTVTGDSIGKGTQRRPELPRTSTNIIF